MISNDDQRKDLLRGLSSAALLAGLLIGVPTLLIFGVGWPLPQGMSSASDVTTAIRTGAIPPSFISKSISFVLWILWLQILTGVTIELWAHFHGRVAPQVAFLPRFVQSLSSRFIGAALAMIFSLQHPGIATADNQELLTPTISVMDIDHQIAEEERSPHPGHQQERLRVLAEHYLGDPSRWDEVYVLNQKQEQIVDESLTDSTRIKPGWKFLIPDDTPLPPLLELKRNTPAASNQQFDLQSTDSDTIKITVKKGDTLWQLATHHFGDPKKWVDIYNSNQDIIQDPNVILPGWELQLPAHNSKFEISLFVEPLTMPTAEPSVELSDHSTPVMAYTTSKASVVANVASNREHEQLELAPSAASPLAATSVASRGADEPSALTTQTVFAIGGLGMFASSLGWILARLYRSQRRRLPSERLLASSTSEAVQLEQQLLDASDTDSALFLDASLRAMSIRIAGRTPPKIIGVMLDSDAVSILLDAPAEAPSGFNGSEDNLIWSFSRSERLEHLLTEAEGVSAPLPTLVSVGKNSDSELLLNLEHVTALNLQGDPEAIEKSCAAMAVQLASSHLADDLTVVCVGFGQDLSVFERVEYVPDVASAIGRIAHQHRQNRALSDNHAPFAITRMGNGSDCSQPAVVIIPGELAGEEARRLLEECGSSVCIAAHGLSGATWLGQFDDYGLLVEPIGLRLEPYGLSAAAVAAVAELATTAKDSRRTNPAGDIRATPVAKLATTAQDSHGVVPEMPSVLSPTDIEAPAPVHEQPPIDVEARVLGAVATSQIPEPARRPPTDVEVRVLGTVDVLGAAQSFTSRRALDLVAYLAFHPEGADRDQLKTHLWPPDDPPSESTLANTVSRARKALGVDDNGKPYLPRVSRTGIYRLRPEVGTDVARFEELASAARSDAGERGRQQLQTALELVRGTPFTGGGGEMFRWADFGLRTHIDCMVDTTAHELAERCLEAGDPEGARRAVITSLRLVGVCEQCYRWRLMAAAENPTELRRIMAELLGLLQRESDQPEADNLISPDLLELYDQLMSGCMVLS
ncbi:MAG: LysM peptidoglycan-binding domain-containing protein [bacterium]|nr:LysM peptidoglycan-binding domain-containing protein [bacterium]